MMDAAIGESYEEDMVESLEATGRYRVLRRLEKIIPAPAQEGEVVYRGAYVDCETTGLDTEEDEIIELGVLPFTFTHDGYVDSIGEPVQAYNEPGRPISEEITRLTGITAETVRGRHQIDAVNLDVDLIVAHNAGFDRKMMERYLPVARKKCWGCSVEDVPWRENGMGGSRLEYLMMEMGLFHNAHGAVADCMAGLRALQHVLGGRPALAHLLDKARATTWHVWATGSPYATKDVLKKRKYLWDAKGNTWHKPSVIDADAERAWLQENIYKRLVIPAEFKKVNAFDRYSVRE